MTGADLQWSEVEVNVAGGLNEDVDKRLLPPGQLAAVINCEFSTKAGSLRKRPGAVLVSPPPNGYAEAGPGFDRLLALDTKNQLLAVDLNGYSDVSPALYAPLDASVDGNQAIGPRRVGFAANALVRRYPVASDLQSDIIADCAYVHTSTDLGYLVYGLVHKQTGNVSVKIIQVGKSSTASEPDHTVLEEALDYDRGGGANNAYSMRAAAALGRYVLVAFQVYTTGGAVPSKIYGAVIDCEGGPSVGAVVELVNDADQTNLFHHDLAESTYTTDAPGVPNWLMVYRRAGEIVVTRFTTPLALVWEQTFAAAYYPRAVSIFERNGKTWVNWLELDTLGDPPVRSWLYAVVNTVDGTVALAPTSWCGAPGDIASAQMDGAPLCSAIAYTADDSAVILMHSQAYTDGLSSSWGGITAPGGVALTPITRWRRARSNGTQDGLREKRSLILMSKPWKDATTGWYAAWCGLPSVNDTVTMSAAEGAPDPVKPVLTGALMRFSEAAATESDLAAAVLMSAIAPLTLQDPTVHDSDTAYSLGGETVPRSVTHPTQGSAWSEVWSVGRRTALNIRYITLETKSGPWDVVVRVNESDDYPKGYGRYMHERFGQAIYCAGGMLTQWDGDRHCEAGFLAAPVISVQRIDSGPLAGGTWPNAYSGKHLFVQAVWETVTVSGERIRSAPSNVLDIQFSDYSPPVVKDVFNIFVEPHTVTMRTYGGDDQEYDTPRTICVLYCSDAPDSSELHRIFPFDDDTTNSPWNALTSNPDKLVPLVWQLDSFQQLEGGGGLPIIEELETIYTDSGELDNDVVMGSCSCVAVHKDRLWAGGGDDPELIWYSKERVDGRPAEFSFGQQIRFAGKGVVALASLDDALIVFCEHSIFAVFGDGPNATGDPSSGIFTVVSISTSVGCNSASSLCVMPDGILFKSESGMCMLDRGRTVKAMSAVIDSSNALFAPIASVVNPRLTQARILYPTDDGNDALVFDWSSGLWATWRYAFTGTYGLVVDQQCLGRDLYILTADGSIHREVADTFSDSGGTYRQHVELGTLNFGRVLGYKRVGHMGLLLEPNTWADVTSDPASNPFGLKATVNLNYAPSGTAIESEWSAYEIGSIGAYDGITLLRMHISKKQPALQVTLDELDPGLYLASSSVDPINTTTGANVLRIKISAGAGFTVWTFTSSAALTKAALLAEVNTKIAAAGWANYLKATVVGGVLRLETIKRASSTGLGSYLAIDSVGNGSTLNTPLGLAAGGAVGASTVAVASQSGFILQHLNFEVGQAPGPRRSAAAQSR